MNIDRHAGSDHQRALSERDSVLEMVEEAGDDWDRAVIDQGIEALNSRGVPWSANDLRPLLPGVRAALIGVRFLAAARRGEMARAGYVTSTDPGTHARPIVLWQPKGTGRPVDVPDEEGPPVTTGAPDPGDQLVSTRPVTCAFAPVIGQQIPW